MAKKLKKVMSLVLAVAMLITSVNLGMISVKADYDATSGLNVYFKYTGEDDKWDYVALHTWSETSVTSVDDSSLEPIEVKSWDDESKLPKMAEDGEWFSAKVKGATLKGIQFVYPVNGDTKADSSAAEAKDETLFGLLTEGATEIYYVYDGVALKAYTDAARENELVQEYVEEPGDATIYFKLPQGTAASDWGFSVWGDAKLRKAGDAFKPEGWGDPLYQLLPAEDGFAYVIINGKVKGFQLCEKANVNNRYDNWNSDVQDVLDGESAEVYYDTTNRKWYSDKACSSEIEENKLLYVVGGDAEFTGWKPENVSEANQLKKVEGTSGVYSLTVTGLNAGVHEFKVLEDPVTNGWSIAYLSETKNEKGDNSVFTTTKTTDEVTFTLDATGETSTLTVEVKEGEDVEYKYQEGDRKLYIKLPDEAIVSDWGFNVWGGAKARDFDGVFKPTGYDDSVYGLKEGEDGFAYVIISGNVAGCQFVTRDAKGLYQCWNSAIQLLNLKEAYFNPSDKKWYKEKGFTNEIVPPVLDELFYVVGDKQPFSWELKELSDDVKLTADGDSKIYTLTKTGLEAGTYQYKILQDPDDFAWEYAMTGKEINTSGNGVFKIEDPEQVVVFAVDATNEELAVSVTVKNSKYNVTVTDGTTESAEYKVGSEVTVVANEPEEGMEFAGWTCEDEAVVFADAASKETTFTMPEKDVTVVANYKKITNTVTFKDGDTVLKTEDVEYGSAATAPEVKSKDGYTYSWDKEFSDIKAETIVNIVWTAKKYKVTFKSGENVLDTQEVEYGKAATAPEVNVSEGYTASWDTPFNNIKEDTIVNLVLTANKYNVVFKDGDTELKKEVVEYGKAATAPTVETKEGYTFAWDKEFSAVKSDLVVNAVWTAKTYTVTFKNGTEVAKTETVAHGKSATAPELTKAGYVLSWDKVFTNITGDLTVTAKWTEVKENQFVVKFVSDGQVVDTQAIDAGSAVKAPELTKEGYSLSWDKAFDKITEDTTITAVWTVKTYTVTFKDGDDILKTESVEYGKGATAPEVKAKEGYTFTWDKAFADIKADTVVSVNWTANKYTVTFKDGERTLKTEEVEYGKSATAPEVEVKEGYSFEWNKAFAEIKEDTEVSVVWTINKYYVTFSDEDVVLKTEEVEYGKSATAPKITVKEGYTFAWDKEFTAIKGDTDVKVIWTANKYTVTFKDGNEVLKTEEVEYGKSATAPTVTAKEGYTYSWDKDIVEIKGNTEVNVVWTINKYTVTFKDGDKVLKAEEVEYSKAATAPELPTKTGYTAKWDIEFTNIKETTDVNVDWVINKYTVTFMNGKEEAAKVEVEHGKSATAPKVTKKGYSLTWDKAFDKVTKDITVTAVWTANKYKLTYDANGGKATSKSKQVTFGSKIGSFPTATRKGYVLKGWYSKKTGGTELTSTSKYATAGNATIYAQWTKVSVGATKVSKVKQVSKKSFQLTLKKVSGVKGYEVVYSTNKSFKSSKTVATNKTSVKVAKLNKATTYYVKARAYKTDSTGAKVYSSYSKVVKVTTKK